MRKRFFVLLSLILLSSGCFSKGGDVAVQPSPTALPTAKVTVITVAPAPTAVPTKPAISLGEPFKITDLTGNYEISFPSCFDICSFESGDGWFSSVYSSSTLEGPRFTVTYAIKQLFRESNVPTVKQENLDITLPTSYFFDGAQGQSEVVLSIKLEYDRNSKTELPDFNISKVK